MIRNTITYNFPEDAKLEPVTVFDATHVPGVGDTVQFANYSNGPHVHPSLRHKQDVAWTVAERRVYVTAPGCLQEVNNPGTQPIQQVAIRLINA